MRDFFLKGSRMLEEGAVLNQRYEVKKRLGRGGNAHVYLVYDKTIGRNRVLKEVRKTEDDLAHIMVWMETELIGRLKYPYFPEILEVLETEDAECIVMEYLEGETLASRLRRMGPASCQEVARWGKDLCLMLNYLHQSDPPVVYRDMKPDNIMVQPEGNLRLIDFGAVMEIGEQGMAPQLLVGTRGYAAPEQFACGSLVDARTDIYALGVTLYQLLTGRDPCEFPGRDYPIFFWKHPIPRKMKKIIRKCTEEDPVRRYQSCEELLEDLKGMLTRRA